MSAAPKVGLLAQEAPPTGGRAPGAVTEAIMALVPELRARRGDWYRIAEFPGKSSASGYAKKLRDRYPGQIETRGTVDKETGGSALYARWTGNRANTGTDR